MIRTGQLRPSPALVQQLVRVLAAHHSKDARFLQQFQRQAATAMAQDAKIPWRCGPCKRLNKSSMEYCGMCGCYWEQCWDKEYTHGGNRSYSQKGWRQWTTWPSETDSSQRPKSPRRRHQSPRREAKGGGKAKQTQAGQQKWPAPVLDYSKIRDVNLEPPATRPAAAAKPTESTAEIQDLIATLQTTYPEGLPPELQAKVDKIKKTSPMDLKRHIGQLTKVKKELDALREARCKHKEAWKRHVETLVQNTNAQLQQYQNVMHDFDTCEEDLTSQFQSARSAILPNHATKQASRRRSTCPSRCGLRYSGRYGNGSNRGGRRSTRWRIRNGGRRNCTSSGNPAHAERLCGFPNRRACKIEIQRKNRRSKGWSRGRKQRCQEGFMRRRSGMKPTQQSVPTERDRPRNLRFSMCVGFWECNYVGSVDTQSPHEAHTFGWTVLEEPKSPTSFLPRRCMTTEDARQYAPEHSISKADDFLNPWEAISRAFELHLEASHCDPPWAPLIPQIDEAVEHREEPSQFTMSSELDHHLYSAPLHMLLHQRRLSTCKTW